MTISIKDIEFKELKSNGSWAILEEPKEHKQHQNQQCGLDLYIKVLNFDTGEECFKKLYKNTKGLHFKHSGGYYSRKQSSNGSHYLDSFVKTVYYVPYQLIED